MSTHAEFEHLSSVLRVWHDDKKYGDPFDWAVAVRWLNKDEVEIMIQQTPLTPDIYRAVMSAMSKAGVKNIKVVTYVDGIEKLRWLEVKDK